MSTKKYVLTSQGIKIFETFDKEEAERLMKEGNDKRYKYKEECIENREPYADNEVFMFEEEYSSLESFLKRVLFKRKQNPDQVEIKFKKDIHFVERAFDPFYQGYCAAHDEIIQGLENTIKMEEIEKN